MLTDDCNKNAQKVRREKVLCVSFENQSNNYIPDL